MGAVLTRLWASPVLLLALTAWMWAANTIAGRLAVGEISPAMLTFLRWMFVISVLWPLYGAEVRAHWSEIRPRLPVIAALGALGYTCFNALYYAGAHYTTAINMGLLQGTTPAMVLVGAYLAHGTRAGLIQSLGVAVTMAGVILIATRGAPLRILELGVNRGDVYLLIACVFYAFYTVGLRDRPKLSGTGFFTLLAMVAAATSVPLLAYEMLSGATQLPTTKGWLITSWVALFPSCLSQLLFLRGVDLIGPGRAGVYVNLVPVFAAILGIGLLNEPFHWYHAASLVLVLGGIALTRIQPST